MLLNFLSETLVADGNGGFLCLERGITMDQSRGVKNTENDTHFLGTVSTESTVGYDVSIELEDYSPVRIDFLRRQYLKSDCDYTYC